MAAEFRDVPVQVNSDDILPRFTNFIKNNSDLSTLTGVFRNFEYYCWNNKTSMYMGDFANY